MSKAPSWIKKSLHLPKSTFPPRPNPSHYAGLVKKSSDDIYSWQRIHRANAPTFTIHDGPPYANGDLHIGHALNKILKDVSCRFQLGQGKRVHFVPGWDCHGLPIELKAVEELEKDGIAQDSVISTGSDATAKALSIRHAARKLASKTIERQKKQFRSWGVMADWENAWKTQDKAYEMKQLEVFKSMVVGGLIHRRFMPVYWSPSTRTALAEAELEYHDDHVSTAAYVKYPLQKVPTSIATRLESEHARNPTQISCIIWTTQPWTLPANRAIGYNPNVEYSVLDSQKHGLCLVASDRVQELVDMTPHRVLFTFSGSELRDAQYSDSLWTTTSDMKPFLAADHVTSETGTGFAHLAPGHGPEDYWLCLKNGISAAAPVDENGAFSSLACPRDPELLSGRLVGGDGAQAVLNHLKRYDQLLHSHAYVHKYPYDWRTKQPVILRATAQWFASVSALRKNALQALDDPQVRFVPAKGKNRLAAFVKNRNEWCISRQRAWGVPIPALYHIETDEALMNKDTVEHIISVISHRGIDAWWSDLKTESAWTPPWLRDLDGTTKYRRGTDTMDVWFDSGTSWTQTTDNDGHPRQADLYLEGSDQHRGWFQSSLLTYVAHEEEAKAPFQTLVTHGFVLDGEGRKMSKSEGNVTAPSDLIDGSLLPPTKKKVNGEWKEFNDAMGPDALRLWAATCDFSNDARLSVDSVKTVNSTLAKLRVTFKQLLGILDGWNSQSTLLQRRPCAANHLAALWQLQQMHTKVVSHCRQYDFHKAIEELVRYINVDLSAFYIETAKDAAYCGIDTQREDVQSTLAIILNVLTRDLAPVTPLLVQEVWDHLKSQDASGWFISPFKATVRDDIVSEYRLDRSSLERVGEHLPNLMTLLDAVRKTQEVARTDQKMGSSLECNVIFEVPEQGVAIQSFINTFRRSLADILVVSDVSFITGGFNDHVDDYLEWHYQREAEISGKQVIVHVYNPRQAKCVRCWRYLAPQGRQPEDSLCFRCGIVKHRVNVEASGVSAAPG